MKAVRHYFKSRGQLGCIAAAMEIDDREEHKFDADTRTFRMVLTEESPLRSLISEKGDPIGDVMVVRGISLKDYKKNPVLLAHHDDHDWPIGRTMNHQIAESRGVAQLQADCQLAPAGINPQADICAGLVQSGMQRAGSIGWLPLKSSEIQVDGLEDVPAWMRPRRWEKSYLLEFSMVSMGLHQNALTLGVDLSDAMQHGLEGIFREIATDVLGYNRDHLTTERATTLIRQFAEQWAAAFGAPGESPTGVDVASVPEDEPGDTSNEVTSEIIDQLAASALATFRR